MRVQTRGGGWGWIKSKWAQRVLLDCSAPGVYGYPSVLIVDNLRRAYRLRDSFCTCLVRAVPGCLACYCCCSVLLCVCMCMMIQCLGILQDNALTVRAWNMTKIGFINAGPGESMFQKTLTGLYFEFSLGRVLFLASEPLVPESCAVSESSVNWTARRLYHQTRSRARLTMSSRGVQKKRARARLSRQCQGPLKQLQSATTKFERV